MAPPPEFAGLSQVICCAVTAAVREPSLTWQTLQAGETLCVICMWEPGPPQIEIANDPQLQTQGHVGRARLVSITGRTYLSFYCPLRYFQWQVMG